MTGARGAITVGKRVVTGVPTPDGVRVSGVVTPGGVLDIGDHCTHCGCDTSPGSGNWVNRIASGCDSADGEWELDGYMCASCQADVCAVCGEETIEWSMHAHMGVVCDDCKETETN